MQVGKELFSLVKGWEEREKLEEKRDVERRTVSSY
jgi:hypothetical protein